MGPLKVNITVWGTVRRGGRGERLPVFKKEKEITSESVVAGPVLDQLTDFCGDHFLCGHEDGQEKQQPI
jgi:hypothetical protein